MSYHHVLCATDFSEVAERALVRALEVARAFGSELTVLHVIEHFPEDLPVGLGAREDQDPRQYLLDSARQNLATLLERHGAPSQVRPRVIVSRQSARHEIMEAIGQAGVDLLVTGTAPRGLLPHLGSTASGLLHATPCDLLVVKS